MRVNGALATAWLTAVVVSAAPQSPPQTPSQRPPVFRTGVDLVSLDVVVTGKDDRPVTGLTKDDFTITSEGRPQTIADFQAVTIAKADRLVTREMVIPTVDVASNVHLPTARQWVMVIDDLHIIELQLSETREVVQEFIRSLPKDDQVAIVFVGRSDFSQDFTNDAGALMRTVDRLKSSLGLGQGAPGSTIGAEGSPEVAAAAARGANRERHRNDDATIETLKNVSNALIRSTYPRKAVMYVSEGFTTTNADSFDAFGTDVEASPVSSSLAKDTMTELQRLMKRSRESGVPIYTIDPRGIPDCTDFRGECPTRLEEYVIAQQQMMRYLAENTGGRAFVGYAEITQAVDELIADNDNFYVLGYYPQPAPRDGKFHAANVTVNRPGLRVRARAGYTAPAPDAKTPTAGPQMLREVLGASLPVSGLSLRAFAAPLTAIDGKMRTVVTVEVVQQAPPDGSALSDTLNVGLIAVDREGKIQASKQKAYKFSGSPKGAREVTYCVNETLELPDQPMTLRIGVASAAQGTAGSIHLPLEVVDPDAKKLQIATIAIGFAGPPRLAALPPNALKDLLPFQPTTTRTFAATDVLRVYAPVIWKGSDAAADVVVTLRRGDNNLTRYEKVAAQPLAGSRRQAILDTVVDLHGLQPGDYLMEIAARVPSSENRRTVAFSVR